MIKLARELYLAVAILSPWLYAIAKYSGIYNRPEYNGLIFAALFTLSAVVLFFVYEGN